METKKIKSILNQIKEFQSMMFVNSDYEVVQLKDALSDKGLHPIERGHVRSLLHQAKERMKIVDQYGRFFDKLYKNENHNNTGI